MRRKRKNTGEKLPNLNRSARIAVNYYPGEAEPLDKMGEGGCLPGNGMSKVFKANI